MRSGDGLESAVCANEPEFRAYVILLNLNDCQFFWELKQLSSRIQQSPEVRFALRVYMAIETGNYVRFFRLVRDTTYMNACILLRYFTQMRVVALQRALRAYVPGRHAVAMSLVHWQYVLAFEDADQTAQFFEYYGQRCDREADRVWLERATLFWPETPVWLERAINVVEHKRECSVGEAIWGISDGPLPEFEARFALYRPHDSFDASGFLRREAWMAKDQNFWVQADRPMMQEDGKKLNIYASLVDIQEEFDDNMDDHTDNHNDSENEDHAIYTRDEDDAGDYDRAEQFKRSTFENSHYEPAAIFSAKDHQPQPNPQLTSTSIFGGLFFNEQRASGTVETISTNIQRQQSATTGSNIFNIETENKKSTGNIFHTTPLQTLPPTIGDIAFGSLCASSSGAATLSSVHNIFGDSKQEEAKQPASQLRRRESLEYEQHYGADELDVACSQHVGTLLQQLVADECLKHCERAILLQRAIDHRSAQMAAQLLMDTVQDFVQTTFMKLAAEKHQQHNNQVLYYKLY